MFYIKREYCVPGMILMTSYMEAFKVDAKNNLLGRTWDVQISGPTEVYASVNDAYDDISKLWISFSSAWGYSANLTYTDLFITDNAGIELPIVVGGILISKNVVMHMLSSTIKSNAQTQQQPKTNAPGDTLKRYRKGETVDWVALAKKKYGS